MLRVNAGVLTRIVTVFISKQYDFKPQSADYAENRVGQEIPLKFTIPSDFPETLLPIKCYIKADGLNPVKTAGQEDMLVEHKDGTIYYIYEAKSTGDKTLMFKTIQTVVDNPTITNDYFEDGTFIMRLAGKKVFSDISAGPAYYEAGSNFTLKFNMESDATVAISGNGINSMSYSGHAGQNTVTLKTTQRGAAGTIYLKAEGYNDVSTTYSNNFQLGADQTITGDLNCGYNYWGWTREAVRSGTIATGNSKAIATIDRQNHYTMTLKAGISVNENIQFTVKANSKTYTSGSVSVSNFFGSNTNMTCTR